MRHDRADGVRQHAFGFAAGIRFGSDDLAAAARPVGVEAIDAFTNAAVSPTRLGLKKRSLVGRPCCRVLFAPYPYRDTPARIPEAQRRVGLSSTLRPANPLK
jgi:hypothetical protein